MQVLLSLLYFYFKTFSAINIILRHWKLEYSVYSVYTAVTLYRQYIKAVSTVFISVYTVTNKEGTSEQQDLIYSFISIKQWIILQRDFCWECHQQPPVGIPEHRTLPLFRQSYSDHQLQIPSSQSTALHSYLDRATAITNSRVLRHRAPHSTVI